MSRKNLHHGGTEARRRNARECGPIEELWRLNVSPKFGYLEDGDGTLYPIAMEAEKIPEELEVWMERESRQ